jgi:hypothetical protein
MRSSILYISFSLFVAIILFGNDCFAGACSGRADSLEAFDSCMVQVPGSIMTAQIRPASSAMDPSHRQLLNAMARTRVVPPHTISPPAAFPMMAASVVANAYRHNNGTYNPYWNWWTMNAVYRMSH